MSDRETAARRFGCPSCGGQLIYDIGHRAMRCTQCCKLHAVGDLPPEPEEEQSDTVEVTVYRCPQCGAEIVSGTNEATGFCSYCGSDVVLEQRLSRMQRPARILPFTVTREKCEELYRDHIRAHALAPHALLKKSVIGHFRAVYIPFWAFRIRSEGTMRVLCSGKKKSGDSTVYTEELLTLNVKIDQGSILYDASQAFEDDTAARLEHNPDGAVPFRACLLSGMYAQAPDAPAELYREEASAAACHVFLEKIMRRNSFTAIRPASPSETLHLPNEEIGQELVLLPVWLLAHRQNGRMLYAAVNGANGRIVCDVPVSAPKVGAITLLAAAALFAALYFLPVMRPDWLLAPCLAAALAIQYLTCTMQRRLVYHEMRETEPDFSHPRRRAGPVTRRLQGLGVQKNGSAGRVVGTILLILLRVGLAAGLSGFLFIIGFIVTTIFSAPFAVLMGVALAVATGLIHFRCYQLITDMAACRARTAAYWQNSVMLTVDILCVILLFSRLAEDAVYYLACIALMGLNFAAMLRLWLWHNRFTTRPVPFFDAEEVAEP